MDTQGPTEIFAERLAVQTRQHDATDPRLIACHFTAGWLAAVDALNARQLAQAFAPTQAPATPQPGAGGGWFAHKPGDPMPCPKELLVDVVFGNGIKGDGCDADTWSWDACSAPGAQIVKWRPARNQSKA